MKLLHLGAIVAFGLSSPSLRGAEPQTPLKTETRNGKYVSARFRPADWKILAKPDDFMGFLDQVYLKMEELTAASPPMELRGYENLGAWGTAGMDGINIDWNNVQPFMNDFKKGKVEFGFVHEMGHVFDARDFARWYITPAAGGEAFANIKLSYAVERLLRDDTPYRIEFGPGGLQTGKQFNDNFFLNAGEEYLNGDTPWDKMRPDDLHSFHMRLIRKVGWDVYKKWFRAYYEIEKEKDGRAPSSVSDPARINLICALLSIFSGDDLVTDFQKWRMPVSDKTVLEIAKRYDLEAVCPKIDAQFVKEYAKGKIHLDPLSLRVKIDQSATGAGEASIFSILRSTPSVVVRYTLDGSPVTGKSAIDSGKPIPLPAGAKINAAMFIPGNVKPILTTTASNEKL